MSTQTYDPRQTFGIAVEGIAEHDERIVVLSADSGRSSGFGGYIERFPDRYLEFGIEEQGVTGVASGLATTGKLPIFCAIAPFVTCRNFEQFRNDLGYMNQDVKIVGRNGGFTYADLGATHHSLEDYAIISMIPGVVVLAPQDATEIVDAVAAMVAHAGPVYMRLGNAAVPRIFEPGTFVIGKGRRRTEGSDVTVISTGYITPSTCDAVDELAGQGISIDHLCLGTVQPLDKELILASAARTGHVITVEEHYDRGGLGGAVAELLAGVGGAVLDRIAVPHGYVPSGPYPDVVRKYGLDAPGIAAKIAGYVRSRAV